MRRSLIAASLIMCLLTCSYGAKHSKGTDGTAPPAGTAGADVPIARIDEKAIYLSDIPYDLQKRYALELHKVHVQLYREQRAELNRIVDRMVLEKEASRRKITPDELSRILAADIEAGKSALEADKENIFQAFLDDLKRGPGGLSGNTAHHNQPGILGETGGPEHGPGGSIIESAKKNIIEMKKDAYARTKMDEFFGEFRRRAEIEIVLEPPELIRVDMSADDDPYLGSSDAPVTIIAFADYQCPSCRAAGAVLRNLLEKKKDTVKLVFRDFPLRFHKNAGMAAEAAECADAQGEFWRYNELLFESQQSLAIENLKDYARHLGLDAEKFNRCLDRREQRAEVEKDAADARLAGITGTPSVFVNGYYISGMPTLAYLEEVIAAIEAGKVPRAPEDIGKG